MSGTTLLRKRITTRWREETGRENKTRTYTNTLYPFELVLLSETKILMFELDKAQEITLCK